MKRIIGLILCVVVLVGAFAGCTGASSSDSPADYKNVKWTTYDYSFNFKTNDNCKGTFKFDDKEYSVVVSFESSYITVKDNSTGKTLWDGQWKYNDDNLYVYGITYNTTDYKEFDENYQEFFDMKKEEL
jgi:hypothetical protein